MHAHGHIAFKLMALCFTIRDLFRPPGRVLKQMGLKPGQIVLDYGCGPGGWSLAAAKLVGPPGKVHAVDMNPLALRRVKKIVSRKGLTHIETIRTNCATGLKSGSVDIAFLFDTYHDLENPDAVVEELHRILKPHSVLLFSDHHLKEEKILSSVPTGGLFGFASKRERIFRFTKLKRQGHS